MSRFGDKFTMPATLDDQAADMLADLEQWERRRAGSIENARRALARKVGLSEGVLERLRRRRLKGVRGYVVEKIQAAFLSELAVEQRRLAHAMAVVEGGLLSVVADEARQARTALGHAKKLIEKAKGAAE